MTLLTTIDPVFAEPRAKALLDGVQKKLGVTPNMMRVMASNPSVLGGLQVTGLNHSDGFKFGLEDGGWLLIRFSGTEPIMRVYCETTHPECVQALLQDGIKVAGLA